MSITSKQRRDARKRREERARNQAEAAAGPASPIEPHAELRDAQKQLLAGIVRRDGQWVLGMNGRIAGESDSAANVLALILRAAELHDRAGTNVRLVYSDDLKHAAQAEAAAQGMTFEQFQQQFTARLQDGERAESH
ncbi:hypothetical protein [Pseudoxanthomonas sp.]|uniref:hypothetical protein n=1 Tax=Pseudoxanthomonas sp. TaxID=1871049 RepID=UPI002601D7D0|nr:hypothetical protein [Pseudoxanthomonas sp.]WDS36267.1 MAG: hypothetical protein O8I58_18695 [Pseudoxanthomonas sp.]